MTDVLGPHAFAIARDFKAGISIARIAKGYDKTEDEIEAILRQFMAMALRVPAVVDDGEEAGP